MQQGPVPLQQILVPPPNEHGRNRLVIATVCRQSAGRPLRTKHDVQTCLCQHASYLEVESSCWYIVAMADLNSADACGRLSLKVGVIIPFSTLNRSGVRCTAATCRRRKCAGQC